ncbi:MAG: ABC transporter permease [Candidatus Bipolaricaulota bacterium]|nr:ABC transporter permease [Candidatus Bipolaricaulota bacterium]
MLREFFRLASQNVLHRKLRSILAVLGVLIGIMAVVILISFGLSLKGLMTGEVAKVFGVDTFMVMDQDVMSGKHSGGLKEFGLNLETLKRVEGVKTVAAIRQRTAFVEGGTNADGKAQQGFMPVMGLSPELLTDFAAFTGDLVFEAGGRQITEMDVDAAVLRRELADRLGIKLGDTILIAGEKSNEITATVVGILAASDKKEEEQQGFASSMSSSSSDTIYVPYATMDRLWPEGNDFLVTVVRILPGYDVDDVADRAEVALKAEGSRVSAITSGDITQEPARLSDLPDRVWPDRFLRRPDWDGTRSGDHGGGVLGDQHLCRLAARRCVSVRCEPHSDPGHPPWCVRSWGRVGIVAGAARRSDAGRGRVEV